MSSTQACRSGPGYATPLLAMKGPREELIYVSLVSCDITKPDCLATVDVQSGKVIHLLEMPHVGDELHHFGWNVCSSCCGDSSKVRRFLVLPGQVSSRLYIVDTAEQRAPKIHKVIEPEEILSKVGLIAPHSVHCLADGNVMISMLGDKDGNAPGGFLLIDAQFNIVGRWTSNDAMMRFNHDFWYQPAKNCMVSSEFAAPKTYIPGLKLSDLGGGKYGQGLCFWNWEERTVIKRVELGEDGKVTLSARFLHDPKSTHGYAVSMSGSIWHWYRDDQQTWQVEKVVQIKGVEASGWPMPVPSFCSHMVISLDDRFMYVSNWFNGDILQYDIKTSAGKPILVGQVRCGASYSQPGKKVSAKRAEFHDLQAGPHMMQLSLDGKRLYVTNSFLSTWDDQFYPKLRTKGSAMIRINCDTNKGGLEIDETFFVDFGMVNGNKYRAHEMRYPGGDCTSDIWLEEHARRSTSG